MNMTRAIALKKKYSQWSPNARFLMQCMKRNRWFTLSHLEHASRKGWPFFRRSWIWVNDNRVTATFLFCMAILTLFLSHEAMQVEMDPPGEAAEARENVTEVAFTIRPPAPPKQANPAPPAPEAPEGRPADAPEDTVTPENPLPPVTTPPQSPEPEGQGCIVVVEFRVPQLEVCQTRGFVLGARLDRQWIIYDASRRGVTPRRALTHEQCLSEFQGDYFELTPETLDTIRPAAHEALLASERHDFRLVRRKLENRNQFDQFVGFVDPAMRHAIDDCHPEPDQVVTCTFQRDGSRNVRMTVKKEARRTE